jgi:hypothetical protein
MQTLPDVRNNYLPESPAQGEFCARRNSLYTLSAIQRLHKTWGKTSGFVPLYQKEAKFHIWTWIRECFRAFPGIWSVAAWPSVLSPSSILLPPSHCTFIPARRTGGAFQKGCFILIILFFFNSVTLKLPTAWKGISKLFFYVTATSFWFHQSKILRLGLQLFLDGFFPTLVPITDAVVSVLTLRLSRIRWWYVSELLMVCVWAAGGMCLSCWWYVSELPVVSVSAAGGVCLRCWWYVSELPNLTVRDWSSKANGYKSQSYSRGPGFKFRFKDRL